MWGCRPSCSWLSVPAGDSQLVSPAIRRWETQDLWLGPIARVAEALQKSVGPGFELGRLSYFFCCLPLSSFSTETIYYLYCCRVTLHRRGFFWKQLSKHLCSDEWISNFVPKGLHSSAVKSEWSELCKWPLECWHARCSQAQSNVLLATMLAQTFQSLHTREMLQMLYLLPV